MDISKFSLEGKVAIVTGACQGIGNAIATTFADAGADMVITCRGKEPTHLQQAADDIRKFGRKVLAIPSHAAKLEDSKNLVQKVKAEFGRIDILVNNAGANPAMVPLIDAEEWLWDTIMGVNVKGIFLLSQLVAREMRAQGGGNIINISSFLGFKPTPKKVLAIYSVSKAAVAALTRTMAQEWGQYNIRVNAIAPGWVRTRIAEAMLGQPGVAEEFAQKSALGRLGMPEDVAGAALFLASRASSYVTGDTLFVEGGSLLF